MAILKATFIVILVKETVSPHTLVIAYATVLIEGFLGYFVFTFIKHEFTVVLWTGFICPLYSTLQKLIITTPVFGTAIWKSIDLFVDFVFSQMQLTSWHTTFNARFIIISLYVLLHFTAGLIAGFKLLSQISGKMIKTLKLEFEATNSATIFLKKRERENAPGKRSPQDCL